MKRIINISNNKTLKLTNVVSSAAAWAVANPAIAAGILGGVVGFVAGVIVAKL